MVNGGRGEKGQGEREREQEVWSAQRERDSGKERERQREKRKRGLEAHRGVEGPCSSGRGARLSTTHVPKPPDNTLYIHTHTHSPCFWCVCTYITLHVTPRAEVRQT